MIAVLTDRWQWAHGGQAPRGSGRWVFRIFVHDAPSEYIVVVGGYSKARMLARRAAKARRSPTVTLLTEETKGGLMDPK